MPLPATYVTAAQLKARLLTALGPAGRLPDADLDPILDQHISTAGQMINDHCGRHFDLLAETRRFDAPASTHLAIADLQAAPPPVITQAGLSLVAGTDYYLAPQPTALHPAYTQVVRVQGGFVQRWGYRPVAKRNIVSVPVSRGGYYDEYLAPATPYGQSVPSASEQVITIAGTWGYAAVVPGPIQQAAIMLAIALYRSDLYLGTGSNSTDAPPRVTFWTQDLIDLCARYVKTEDAGADE